MANALVLETLSLKELGALGASVRLKYWQHLRKGDLLERLAALNRVFTQEDLDLATVALARKQAARAARAKVSQGASSLDLLDAGSDVSSSVQTSSPCASIESSDEISESSKEYDPKKSESENVVQSSVGKIPSKNKKSGLRSGTLETSNVEVPQEKTPSEPSSKRQESSTLPLKIVSSETSVKQLNVEKVVSIAEQVVPMLATRLAKRLAERLTQELALDVDLNLQEIDRSSIKDGEKSEPRSKDVATLLVDEIIPSSLDASIKQAKASKLEDARDADVNKPENAPTKEDVVKEAPQENSSSESTETAPSASSLKATKASSCSPKSPTNETSSFKDKLRLKKYVGGSGDKVDRLTLMVCDPYWIRACWEVTSQLVERVRSAMAWHWHTADPVLRLYRIEASTNRREFVKDVEIVGGVSNWYVPVEDPPESFMVELGYKSRDGQFFTLLSSNTVQTPKQFVRDSNGRPCVDSFNAPFSFHSSRSPKARRTQAERLSALDERPGEPFAPSKSTVGSFASTDDSFVSPDSFLFQADAEVLFTGRVSNGATVKVKEEPVCQAQDGSFSIRFTLPERRHVFPIVATSRDENETQTIIIAIERNTKALDPVFKDDEEE